VKYAAFIVTASSTPSSFELETDAVDAIDYYFRSTAKAFLFLR